MWRRGPVLNDHNRDGSHGSCSNRTSRDARARRAAAASAAPPDGKWRRAIEPCRKPAVRSRKPFGQCVIQGFWKPKRGCPRHQEAGSCAVCGRQECRRTCLGCGPIETPMVGNVDSPRYPRSTATLGGPAAGSGTSLRTMGSCSCLAITDRPQIEHLNVVVRAGMLHARAQFVTLAGNSAYSA